MEWLFGVSHPERLASFETVAQPNGLRQTDPERPKPPDRTEQGGLVDADRTGIGSSCSSPLTALHITAHPWCVYIARVHRSVLNHWAGVDAAKCFH